MKRLRQGALRALFASTIVILAAAGSSPAQAAPTKLDAKQKERMIRIISNAPREGMVRRPGLDAESIEKIMTWRRSNDEFESIEQIQQVAGLSDEQFEALKGSFSRPIPDLGQRPDSPGKAGRPARGSRNEGSAMAARKSGLGAAKPGAAPDAADEASPKKPEPPATGGLNLSVRPHYYYDLPGIDLAVLNEAQKKAFLDTINSELCSCGCSGETLGFCYVNDPGCGVIKARVKKLYKEFVQSTAKTQEGSSQP